MAKYVEEKLENHVTQQNTYIKDTTDFIRKINKLNLPPEKSLIMFCMDVKALYPSVPRKEARIAVQSALQESNDADINTDAVLQMMDFILENNNFEFNGQHYTQIDGTAIGSKLGRNYACTYLGAWEKELLSKTEKKPLTFWRYIDDIWGIWEHGEEELLKFQACANTIHENIQIVLRHSQKEIEFLDVKTLLNDNNKITTDLYEKKSNAHLYLHQKSNHPNHTKDKIAYGLAIRAKRICSNNEDYTRSKKDIQERLQKRGHNRSKIRTQLERVDNLPRTQLLQYNEKRKDTAKIPLTLNFSKGLPNINKILRKHEKILSQDNDLASTVIGKTIVGYKRNENLKDIIIHRKHNKIFFKSNHSTNKCGTNCAICRHLKEGKTFEDNRNNKYEVKGNISCKTANLVYGIYCNKCMKTIYVGETGNTLYQRHLLNLSRIRTGRNTDPLNEHFRESTHSLNNFQIFGIEKCNKDEEFRKVREEFWIKKLNTTTPNGLNKKSC